MTKGGLLARKDAQDPSQRKLQCQKLARIAQYVNMRMSCRMQCNTVCVYHHNKPQTTRLRCLIESETDLGFVVLSQSILHCSVTLSLQTVAVEARLDKRIGTKFRPRVRLWVGIANTLDGPLK